MSRTREHWSVTVERNGENVVTIESGGLGGRELSPEDEETIRIAARNLLAFVGAPPPSEDVVCEHGTALDVHCCGDGGLPYPGCHSGFLFDRESCRCTLGVGETPTPSWAPAGSALILQTGPPETSAMTDQAHARDAEAEVEALDHYELIERIHGNTAGHHAFVVDCTEGPCAAVGNPHPFRTAPPEWGWNQPGECYLCGESGAHANHDVAVSRASATDEESRADGRASLRRLG